MKYSVFGLVLALALTMSGFSHATEEKPTVLVQGAPPLVETIHPGMTRAEVETWLTSRDGGPQSISQTRYYQAPGWIIEVPYDQTGGTWTLSNRVNGPVNAWAGPRSNL